MVRALLDRGHRPYCLVLDPGQLDGIAGLDVPVLTGDVTRPDTLPPALEGIDAVAHVAGIVTYLRTSAARRRLDSLFVGGTRNLLDAAANAGVRRFLLTSSIATLGWLPEGQVGDEDTPWNWETLDIPYFKAKKGAEDLVLAETRMEGLAVNPGIAIGAGDLQFNALRMIQQVASGRIPGVPPGSTTLANLSDVAWGHVAALERGRPATRYVLGGTTSSFLDLYSRIGMVVGAPAPKKVLSPRILRIVATAQEFAGRLRSREPALTRALVEISIRNRRYTSARAERELGYTPRPIEHGIAACWNWFRDMQGTPKTPR